MIECGNCGSRFSDSSELCPNCDHPVVLPVPASTDGLPAPVDWGTLFAREGCQEWLVEGLWPTGRQLHVFAAHKTGKSLLMLWIAANLATGCDPFTGATRVPVRVTYLDHEMTEDDLLERIEEMGFGPDDLAGLVYYLHPPMAPLDTAEGGRDLLALVERDRSEVVVIDTVSRVIEGEENKADTFHDLYRHTGSKLKARGVSVARLDHEGHEGGRSRGSSAKGDDVDVLWRLTAADGGGYTLTRTASRIGWVPEKVALKRLDDRLGFTRTADAWPAGTAELASLLDALDVPLDATRRAAGSTLRAAGHTAKNTVLGAAQRWRRERGPSRGPSETVPGDQPSGPTPDSRPDLRGPVAGTTGDQ